MPDLKVSKIQTTPSRSVPDYTCNRERAKELALRVQQYYHQRNYKDVRCWVEPELLSNGRKIWGVRSNIIFSLENLH